MSENESSVLDLGSIDFTPDWARKEASVNIGHIKPMRDDEGGASGGRQGGKPFERDAYVRKPRDRKAPDRKPFGRKPSDYEPSERKSFERKPFDRKPFERKPRFTERPKPLDAEVKILPESKALGTVIRKLQQDSHAYKLKDLAYFFLDNLQSILLKVTLRASDPSAEAPRFYQCKACGFASDKAEDVLEHALAAHLMDYYDAKEIACEPPTGNFTCVAKCGLSGVLLGPPNIHEFNAVVREMIRTRYPEMSEEQYRAHIEMVRDAEVVEEWRKNAVKKTVFFAKGQAEVEGAVAYTREQAEGEFKRTILPSLLDQPKHLMITADVALKSPVKPLQWAVNDAIEAERRAPYNMCFALRGAFHHRKLNFFRANDARGPEFVINGELKPFDAEHAIPELASVARFVAEHPCCDKSELPAGEDVVKHLEWLVSTGHVVAFTNGVYSQVEKYPKYGPQWKKRTAKPKVEDEVAKPEESKPEGTKVEEPKAEVPQSEASETEPKVAVEPAEPKVENVEEMKNETAPVVAE